MRRHVINIILLAVTIGCSTTGPPRRVGAPVPDGDTVCTVLSAGAAFRDESVMLKSIIKSDGLEYLMLVDAGCPWSGLPVQVAAERDPKVDELLRHVYGAAMRQEDTEIRADFIGYIDYRPGEVPSVVLKLKSVRNVVRHVAGQ